MVTAQRGQNASVLSLSLAGLQAGMLAAFWMLAWMGASASWQRSSFWTPENLLASTFFGPAAIKSGFSASTVSGIALYLLLYSVLGSLFAAGLRNRLAGPQLLLAGVLLSVAWYFISFHGIWKVLNPLVALLHAERPTVLGHMLYGVIIARYPRYLGGGLAEQQSAGQDSDSEVAVAESAKKR